MCVCYMLMRGFLLHDKASSGHVAAESQLSDLTPGRFGLRACDALVFGPQLCAGWEHMLPGPIWSPHRGNRVKVNPDRRFANVLSPLALHQIACDEYIPYPPLYPPLVPAGEAPCSLKVWLQRLLSLFYNLLTATKGQCRIWHIKHKTHPRKRPIYHM